MNEPFDIDEYMEKASNHLAALNQTHQDVWGLGNADRWDADQETGILSWTFPDGTIVRADFQIVGTYNLEDGSFLWGWDHPSVELPLREDAQAVLQMGQDHDIDFLQWRKLDCSEEDVWRLVALATLLNDRQGAYRGPAGNVFVFMTFGQVQIGQS